MAREWLVPRVRDKLLKPVSTPGQKQRKLRRLKADTAEACPR